MDARGIALNPDGASVERGIDSAPQFGRGPATQAPATQAPNDSALEDLEASIANLPDVYFIEVDGDGTKTRGSYGTSVTKNDTGSYEVEFPVDDVHDCTWSGTIARQRTSAIWVGDLPTGQILLESDFDILARDIDSIYVSTVDDDGTAADRPFMIQITCGLPLGIYIPPIIPIIIP